MFRPRSNNSGADPSTDLAVRSDLLQVRLFVQECLKELFVEHSCRRR
jgi:hypothetical protein